MPTFSPPVVHDVPTVVAPGEEGELGNRLMRYYSPRPRGLNVYIYREGSDIANQLPDRVSETDPYTTYNDDGTVSSNGWDDVEAVFWGGHEAVTVTDEQATLLEEAGYTVDP